ncbi:ParB/RepB/Spo0J family partition protein [Pseudooceanicola nanhaiensis]|uniref:ParB/RepB/Spo0J family partition protein n=1 Tax=Pseudooceanicola nanhaiensis TaxID=375761 RepID=UPI001CD265FD|nr:ParB N-terminal domain-containing protein [Pseudooceanicola nanhaiensis]MCA0922652.1 ParB N-terminal domain-containing protein [Pseudooceanicola nanhaiensis]
MSRKRRIFDISMPEEDSTPSAAPAAEPAPAPEPEAKAEPDPQTFPAGKVAPAEAPRAARRGPMATAIGETADSLRERREVEARIRAENDRLAHEHVRLKRLGLVVDLLPLDAIHTSKLVRDRAAGPDEELGELRDSIRALGLSNPIRVEEAEGGRYELIQGFRRLSAYRALLEETGDESYATIPAAITPKGEGLDALYRRMVDENLVRKDISFAEMAQLAIDYAADPETATSDADKAVAELFKSAGYQKRSYIRSFIRVIAAIGPQLQFAPEIPRALGLALAARLEEVEGLAGAIAEALGPLDNRSVKEELEVLRRFAGLTAPAEGHVPPARAGVATPKPAASGKAKTSFQFDRREGRAKCTAANGRLELRLDRDFSTIDRRKLEQAVRKMLDQLD